MIRVGAHFSLPALGAAEKLTVVAHSPLGNSQQNEGQFDTLCFFASKINLNSNSVCWERSTLDLAVRQPKCWSRQRFCGCGLWNEEHW